MGIQIRLPQITGTTEREQLLQMKSYLYQLREELQWAFENVNTAEGAGASELAKVPVSYSLPSGTTGESAAVTFNSLKSLIIKSAEIVDAYYMEIYKRLEGVYVAQSDFGDFVEKTTLNFEATSKDITQKYENVQIIIRANKDEIEGDLQTIGQDLSYKEQELIIIKGNVQNIEGSISTIEGNIGDLDGELQNAKGEFQGSIEGAKDELNENINISVEAANAYTDSAKNELAGKITENSSEIDTKIDDVNGRIDETNSNVGNLGEGLENTNNRIDGVESELTDAKNQFSTGIQEVANSVSYVDRLLESAKAQLQGSIDDLEFDLRGVAEIIVGVTAYIKSGLLYYTDAGIPVYGIEIGQEVESNGTKVFNKFSRFTSEKLSFYDANGNEVAYISDKKLYIGQAEITISFKVGGLVDLVMNNGDVVTKWEGVSG